ncbi:MAG: hypothetical protein M1389_05375 [Chloroflexi bacterium]|nr:hypothetical protein [Chloroflexota bacterium]
MDQFEKAELDELAATGMLSPLEVKRMSLALYDEARKNAIGDRILTQEEYDYLSHLQAELGIADAEISRNLRELTRLRLLTEIQQGELPAIETTAILKKGEDCHLECPAELLEERTVSRTMVADSTSHNKFRSSMSESLMKSLNVTTIYETHDKQLMAVDRGTLTITSHRCIFSGERESFPVSYDKLLSVGIAKDCIRLAVEGRKAVRVLSTEDDEVVAAMISRASRTYHEEQPVVAKPRRRIASSEAANDSGWTGISRSMR